MGQFAEETAVERIGEGRWRGTLCRGWRIGEALNGGYLLAVAGRALSEALPHKDPLSVNAFYLAPARLGPVECEVELLREGGNTSQAHARLSQEGELKVVVSAAFTDLERLRGPDWTVVTPPHYPAWEACEANSNQQLEFAQRVEVRLVEGWEVFAGQAPGGRGEFCGWMAHADGADPDPLSLLMFADAMPPPVFDVLGLVGWVPTVELTVQVRARPAPGPLKARLWSRHLGSGVVEEDGEYWDSQGTLVALSRQSARVRLPPKAAPATSGQ
jgi:acyl-CoA thioesterase